MILEDTLGFSFVCFLETFHLFKALFSIGQLCKNTAFLSRRQKGWVAPGFHLTRKSGLFPQWHHRAGDRTAAHSPLLPPAGSTVPCCPLLEALGTADSWDSDPACWFPGFSPQVIRCCPHRPHLTQIMEQRLKVGAYRSFLSLWGCGSTQMGVSLLM